MESLLCDEVWPSNNFLPTPQHSHDHDHFNGESHSFHITKEDCEEAFNICLEKELNYMPLKGYVELLQSQKHLFFARCKAIQWFIKSRILLNLSFETVFSATNYFDRFISMNNYYGSESWIIELVSIACLSIASKFNETCTPSLNEIQMEGLDHSFQSSKIMQMEFILLQALGWRLNSTTSYSYVELLPWKIDHLINKNIHENITKRVTELLLGAILDVKLLEYRPSAIAISALWCTLEELIIPLPSNVYLNFFDQNQQMDELIKCHIVMEARIVNPVHYYPSSPVSVLLTQRSHEVVSDCQCNISITNNKLSSSTKDNSIILESTKKRKREEI